MRFLADCLHVSPLPAPWDTSSDVNNPAQPDMLPATSINGSSEGLGLTRLVVKAMHRDGDGRVFYGNSGTGETSWQHPLEDIKLL